MGKILLFKTKKDLDASAQVKRFIEFSRDKLTVWGEDLDWEATVWDVTKFNPKPGKNEKNLIQWYKLSEEKWDTSSSKAPMEQPFGDFARAYVRNYQVVNQLKVFHPQLIALRILERALKELSGNGEVRVEYVDRETLERCAEILRQRYSNRSQQSYCSVIAQINRFLMDHSMVNHPCDWRNPFPFIKKNSVETDNEVVANRNSKLPSEAVYNSSVRLGTCKSIKI